MTKFTVSIFSLVLACNGGKSSEDSGQNTGNGCDGTSYEGTAICNAWLYNTSNTVSSVLQENGAGIAVNVTSTEVMDENGDDILVVTASGIPDYDVTFSQSDIDALNARPNAVTDFVDGVTNAQPGVTYQFGADIGYSSNTSCPTGAGYGWWPPGPVCPTNQFKEVAFPLNPTPASAGDECETGLGALGLFVNGVSIYNWSDGASYNNEGAWMNVAAQYEAYDLGPCRGHAANGDYHHHDLSSCLVEQLSDDGSQHSPVYGAAADGYLIYGPYQDAGTMAQSCWMARDYNNSDDPYGCGGTGERSCFMIDVFNPESGVENASSNGPRTNEIVTSMSGNDFVATTGFYKEDYYYDPACSTQGATFLDEHNGHEHDDLGYHYHITMTYPYFTGPTLYGAVLNSSNTKCDGVTGGSGGPGGPGGPGGQ